MAPTLDPDELPTMLEATALSAATRQELIAYLESFSGP